MSRNPTLYVKVDEEGFPDVVRDSEEMGPGSSKDNKCIV
mgnify:FL=1